MSKAKGSTKLLKGEQRLRARAFAELSETTGIPVAELRERVSKNEEREQAAQMAARERTARFSLGEIKDALTDIHDLANCAKLGRAGALDPTTILHAIECITESCREEFDGLCKGLSLTPLHFDQDTDPKDKE